MNLTGLESQLPAEIYFTDAQRGMLEKTRDYAREFNAQEVEKGLKYGSHVYDHWDRVAVVGGIIACNEKAPPFLPVLSGFLHDFGRLAKEDPRSEGYLHGQLSAELVADFVDGLPLSREEKDLTLQSIEDHPYRNENVRENDVVKTLMDADRIDGLGAIEPIRSTAFRWRKPCFPDLRSPEPLNDQTTVYGDIERNLGYEQMFWTDSARVIAAPRIAYLKAYRQELLSELQFVDRCAQRLGL